MAPKSWMITRMELTLAAPGDKVGYNQEYLYTSAKVLWRANYFLL